MKRDTGSGFLKRLRARRLSRTVAQIAGFRSLRLRTLVWLRWLAVIGQTIIVLVTYFGLGFSLPLAPCLAVILLSIFVNIFITLLWRPGERLTDWWASLLLAYDVLQLSLLLFLTGGLENPFSMMFMVPIAVSGTSLPLRWTLMISALTLMMASLLAFWHLPLPMTPGHPLHLPAIYVAGLWTALVSAVTFSGLYGRRISHDARQMFSALAATELVLAREQRLFALDGLAAAAAHALGTPLATISLVAREIRHGLAPGSALEEDIDLLITQALRCRDILSRLALRDAQADAMFARLTLSAMIEDILAPLRGPDVSIVLDIAPLELPDGSHAHGLAPMPGEPVFVRNPAILYGLANLVENALDFARSTVTIRARWSTSAISIEVCDDGPGIAQAIFARLGDPFVTSRPGYGLKSGEDADDHHEGMGLGFFIAKTLLGRSGARLSLENGPVSDPGARITVSWPRHRIEARPGAAPGPGAA